MVRRRPVGFQRITFRPPPEDVVETVLDLPEYYFWNDNWFLPIATYQPLAYEWRVQSLMDRVQEYVRPYITRQVRDAAMAYIRENPDTTPERLGMFIAYRARVAHFMQYLVPRSEGMLGPDELRTFQRLMYQIDPHARVYYRLMMYRIDPEFQPRVGLGKAIDRYGLSSQDRRPY